MMPDVVLVPSLQERWALVGQPSRSMQDFTRLRIHVAGASSDEARIRDVAAYIGRYVDEEGDRWPTSDLRLESLVSSWSGSPGSPPKFKAAPLRRAGDIVNRLDVQGHVVGVSVIVKGADGTPSGVGSGSLAVNVVDSTVGVDISRELHPALLDDPSLADEVAHLICGAIDVLGPVEWGAAWFGGWEHEPYVTRLVDAFDSRLLHGYSWVVAITPHVASLLGNSNTLVHSLREVGASVCTCHETVVAAISGAPSDVTADRLRRWREVLRPALVPLSERWHRIRARQRGDVPLDPLPPFLFADDWYYPGDGKSDEA